MRTVLQSLLASILLGIGTPTVQLPPDILLDRHIVRAERLLLEGNAAAAQSALDDAMALVDEHDELLLPNAFHYHFARVALDLRMHEAAVASLNEYLLAAGREGQFYRDALRLLDEAEEAGRRADAERRAAERRADAERQRADRERRARETTQELIRRQLAAAASPVPRDRIRSGGMGPELVRLPAAARFQYTRYDSVDWVSIDSFAISKHEITFSEFERFADRTDYRTDAERSRENVCNPAFSARARESYLKTTWKQPRWATVVAGRPPRRLRELP